jgi:hypothetical protein
VPTHHKVRCGSPGSPALLPAPSPWPQANGSRYAPKSTFSAVCSANSAPSLRTARHSCSIVCQPNSKTSAWTPTPPSEPQPKFPSTKTHSSRSLPGQYSESTPTNPVTAALSSLLLFAAGALIPLMPWFFTRGIAGAAWSFALTAVGALFVGAYVSRSAGMPQWKGALRQLLIVIAAASVTYGIGKLAGTAIG